MPVFYTQERVKCSYCRFSRKRTKKNVEMMVRHEARCRHNLANKDGRGGNDGRACERGA